MSNFLWNIPIEEVGMIKDIKANFRLMAKCPKSSRIGPKLVTAEEEIRVGATRGRELAGNGVCASKVGDPSMC